MGQDYKDIVSEVKDRVDIVDVISQRLELDKSLRAICPFHNDKNPSLSVNRRGQYFHCFGCGAGGDVIKFIELFEGKSFWEALRFLAMRAGITLESVRPEDNSHMDRMRSKQEILSAAARFYHSSLSEDAHDYLKVKRGFTEETIAEFMIGYAAGGLREYLIQECRFDLELCLASGMLKRTEKGENRDYFYQRVIFPHLINGSVVNMTGRSIDDYQPKYLHLKGEIDHLYNEGELRHEEVLIAEGIPDCLSAIQAGFHAVAILGVNGFRPEFVNRFSRVKRALICLDPDEPGIKAAKEISHALGDKSLIVSLPDEFDLNEFVRSHSTDEFKSQVEGAKSLLHFKLNQIPADSPKSSLPVLLRPLVEDLSGRDPATQEAFLNHELKRRFGLTNEDLKGYRRLIKDFNKSKRVSEQVSGQRKDTGQKYKALFDGLVDILEKDGEPAYLVKRGEEIEILHEIEIDGEIYRPPKKDQIPWLLARAEKLMELARFESNLSSEERDKALYDDLNVFLHSVSELPGEEYYCFLTAWVMHTYITEKFQYSPIICLFAVPERGKTRTGKALTYLSYRGIHVESLRDPYIIRIAEDFGASIFFDVRDIWKKAEKEGSDDIILLRFERGARVPRVLFPEKGSFDGIRYFKIFGPTIIGTNEGMHKILETRAIMINMPESTRRFDNDITPESVLSLKERLLNFRARHIDDSLPDVSKPTKGRLGDILKSILQTIRLVKPEHEPLLLKLIKQQEADRSIEKSDSFEGEILRVVDGLRSEVDRSILAVKRITDELNSSRAERFKVTYQKVGKTLKSLGLKKAKMGNGAAAIIWEELKINRLLVTYGVRESSESSEMSETSQLQADVSDESDVSDVLPGVSREELI